MITNIPLWLRAAVLSCALLLLCGGAVSLRAQGVAVASAGKPVAPRASQTQTGRSTRSASRNQRQIKIRIRAGDTLDAIANRFGIPASEIARVNGLNITAALSSGHEIIVPPVSSATAASTSSQTLVAANHNGKDGRSRLSLTDGSVIEADDVWEDAQGVRYRRGGVTYLIERSRVRSTERGTRMEQAEKASAEQVAGNLKPVARLVEVGVIGSEKTMQPVWIYLVGGARVEADEATETAAGVWYRRGNLSIYLDRLRVERIEREPPVVASDADATRSWKERGWSTGNGKIDTLIRQNGARHGVDPYLIFCVMEQESHFNPRVVSPKGARGLMQLMPGTGARFGVRRPFDPAENIMGGTRYLKQLLEQFNGRVDLVLAGYNAGEGAVMKYGGRVPPYRETRDYVKRISKRYGQNKPPVAASKTPVAAAKTSNVVAEASRLR
jgi:hypothetical protein